MNINGTATNEYLVCSGSPTQTSDPGGCGPVQNKSLQTTARPLLLLVSLPGPEARSQISVAPVICLRTENEHASSKPLCDNVCPNCLNVIVSCVSGEVYVPLWVKRGTLKFPEDKDIPVIMVGPGTGVAPFRSAVQERIAEGKHSITFIFNLTLYQHGCALYSCSLWVFSPI